jgi:ribosomal protein L25 (general stress protein Ctc)
MKKDVLQAEKRNEIGTNAVKKIRNAHFIPGVLYEKRCITG